jgi:anti-sigma regulatory factor (Ser/Thr protein kinase)
MRTSDVSPVLREEVTRVRAHIRLAPVPTSARAARRFVSETLAQWGADRSVESAALLVSELVTNAVEHARTEVDVVIGRRRFHRVVRIEVRDRSAHRPRMGGFDPTAPSGRGLALVDALSDRWGVKPDATGKRVWFELEHRVGSRLEASQPA